ncbi:MAG TPA: molybdopterin oxidoreductase family protein [Acidimicrobiia bacterium]|nr:molybdopterin oxidoreductase family protein [Acidimicrobiia bacterium]
MSELAFRTCPLCEATCGLEIEVKDDGGIGRIRGDRDDVFSHGFICPKGSTLKQLHEDPDRLRTPMVRGDDGELHAATWDEAFAEIARRLPPILEQHGRDAVAIYLGNPTVHSLSASLYSRFLVRALGTSNVYSASTVDQRPKEIACGLLFGTSISFAVPDLDRTSYLLLLGANPFESNGSLATAPDWPGRLERIVERGGRVVVVDPKRTKTAEVASEHVPIRPGTDALLLMAMVHVLFDEGLVELGRLNEFVAGVQAVEQAARDFSPEAVSPATAIDAEIIRRLTRELAAAETAAVYGRLGTCTQEFGTLASWLVDVLNILTGNLDRPGGAMFAKPASGGATTAGTPGKGRGVTLGRRASRVRGLPESYGELPVVCLAEEIETPGDGQIRALITVGGNPALSAPNSSGLQPALASLEFMVSVDPYVNETTSNADVILPSPSILTKSHYDVAFYQFALRNVANYSPPVLPPEDGAMDEWKSIAKLALIAQGMGADADPAALDDLVIRGMAERAGLDPDETIAELAPRVGPERMLDLMLRTGPYKLTLEELLDHPHGIDLGQLEPRVPDVLRTESGMIEMAAEPLLADVPRLKAALGRRANGGLVLIGRRHLRSNNSWMHNVGVLMKGKPRCTLQIHPDDAQRLGLDGKAKVTSRTGTVVVDLEVTDAVMPGVVSLPHGWGHDLPGVEMDIARANAGVNSNILADEELFDPLSGNAVLNGVPVEVTPA